MPWPHTTQRSPQIIGRVVDAQTLDPIPGAQIFLSEHPKVACKSDRHGRFTLPATRNFHYAVRCRVVEPPLDVPEREQWGTSLTITHIGYVTQKKDPTFKRIDRYWHWNAGDVLLQPIK